MCETGSEGVMATEVALLQTVSSQDLAREINSQKRPVFLLDCRPAFSYTSCHISGAANVNMGNMVKRRFLAGKLGLVDLLSSAEGKEVLQNGHTGTVVVYDDCTTAPKTLPGNNTVTLVSKALWKLGKTPLLLKGGLSEFGVLHPSLCEVSVSPLQRALSTGPRATTPGQRDQALGWKTAPPVFILSYLVLGSEEAAHCREVLEEFGVKYVLNVTAECPNYYEEEKGFVYKRVAVNDTGTQKLSEHFTEAFAFIELARKDPSRILIHCMAGISRSVTLTVAYLMRHFSMSMQAAYQYVKERRPAISPNLNFMGQLVEFENSSVGEGALGEGERQALQLEAYTPSLEQEQLSERVKVRTSCSGSSSKKNTPEASRSTPEAATEGPRFVLKLTASKKRKNEKMSPRTSPRILTGAAVELTPTNLSVHEVENEGGKEEVHAANSVAAVNCL